MYSLAACHARPDAATVPLHPASPQCCAAGEHRTEATMGRRQTIHIPGVAHNAPIPFGARVGNVVYSSGIQA